MKNYFTSEKISEHVIKIVCPKKVFAFLAIGTKRALLIDTGFGLGSLKSYVDSLTSLPYDVVLTHGHLDHVGGANEFDKVYICEKDLELAGEHGGLEIRYNALKARDPNTSKEDMISPKPISEYLMLEDGQEFDLGSVTVKMVPLAGHTKGSMCAWFVEDKILLLGDACNSLGFLQLPGALSLKEYRDNVVELEKYYDKFDKVIFSHPHNFGEKNIIKDTIALCDEIISGQRVGIPRETKDEYGQILIAKEIDDRDRPVDGSCANFLYRENNII